MVIKTATTKVAPGAVIEHFITSCPQNVVKAWVLPEKPIWKHLRWEKLLAWGLSLTLSVELYRIGLCEWFSKSKVFISQRWMFYKCNKPDYLKVSLIFRMMVMVSIGSVEFANFWTGSRSTLMKGLICFSSPMVDGTVGSLASRLTLDHSIFSWIATFCGSTWCPNFKFCSEYSWPQ